MRKHRRDTASVTSSLSSPTGESGLTGGTRVNVTPVKCIPKNQKYIKLTYLSLFFPRNKILLNEDNYDDPETTDTSLSGKYDMSHTSPDDFTEKNKWQKITNNDDEYKEETSKIQEGNESFYNYETSDALRDEIIIKTTKKIEALIQRLRTMDFKYHVIHSVIDIVSLYGGEWYNWQKKRKQFQKNINGNYLLLFQ